MSTLSSSTSSATATSSTAPSASVINGDFKLLRVFGDQVYGYQHPCSTFATDVDLKRGGWKDWSVQFSALLNKRLVTVGHTKIILPIDDKRTMAELKEKYVCYNCGYLMSNPSRMTVNMDSGFTFSCQHLACRVCWEHLSMGECLACSNPEFVKDIHYNEYDITSLTYVKDEDLAAEIEKLQLLCNCGDISSLGNCAEDKHHHCSAQERKSPFSKLSGTITLLKLREIVTNHLTESWQLLHALDSLSGLPIAPVQLVQVKKGRDDSQMNGIIGIVIKPTNDDRDDDDELSDADEMPDLVSFDGELDYSQPADNDHKSPAVPSTLQVLSSPLSVPTAIGVPLERRTVILPYFLPAQAQAQVDDEDEEIDYEGDEGDDYEGDDDDYESAPVIASGVRPTL